MLELFALAFALVYGSVEKGLSLWEKTKGTREWSRLIKSYRAKLSELAGR